MSQDVRFGSQDSEILSHVSSFTAFKHLKKPGFQNFFFTLLYPPILYNPGTHSSLIKAGNPIFEMLLGHQSQGLIFSKDKEKKSLKKV